MPCLGQCNPLNYKSVGRVDVNDGEIDLSADYTLWRTKQYSLTIYEQSTLIVSFFLLHCNSNMLEIFRIYGILKDLSVELFNLPILNVFWSLDIHVVNIHA